MAQPAASRLPGAVQPGRNDRPQPTIPTQPDFDFSIEGTSRSPVGRALIGKALGETVSVTFHAGTRELTVAEIDYL